MTDCTTTPGEGRGALVFAPSEARGLLALAREIQQEHRDRKSGVGTGHCVACREKWPCKPLRLAAPLTEAS